MHYFCEIILNRIHQLERSGHSKFLSTFSSDSHLVQWSGIVLIILVQDHERNISVKLF